MISSRYQDISSSFDQLSEAIRISGATATSASWILAQLTRTENTDSFKRVVVVCPTDDQAESLSATTELFLGLLDSSVEVKTLPSWHHTPYSSVSLSLKTRFHRISTLSRTLGAKNDLLIFTSLPSAFRCTMPTELFQKLSLSVEKEKPGLSRDQLILALSIAGYQRVDPVEDPGTFSLRGEIIDIFPPDRALPLRIELFGDLVERIREFDPSSQRTHATQELTQIEIPPAREVLFLPENRSFLRQKLKDFGDSHGISKAIRDPVLAAVELGNYSDHSESWASFAYENPATFWDYLFNDQSFDASLFWYDELGTIQNWQQFLEDQEKRSEKSKKTGIFVPEVSDLYSKNSSFSIEKLQGKYSRLFFDQLELISLEARPQNEPELNADPKAKEPLLSNRQKIQIKTNHDLPAKTKNSLDHLQSAVQKWIDQGFQIFIFVSTVSQMQRIEFLLEQRKLLSKNLQLKLGYLEEGFRWPKEKLAFLSESEALGSPHLRKNAKATGRKNEKDSISQAQDWIGTHQLTDLSPGDTIVHIDHGIGRYQGLVRLGISGAENDFITLEYANKDKLYIPVYRLNVIQKYVGGESRKLDRLGNSTFQKAKEKVRTDVKKLAIDLVDLYAKRKVQVPAEIAPQSTEYREFEATFAFDETPDQQKAIEAVQADLGSGKIMDRLVCGDVGYGKTEVAIRAAFRMVLEGKQVAVLVPTTVLAQQHEISFKSRLADYPFVVESLSRFKNRSQQSEILENLKKGKVDIIIGTHRLLSQDVRFQDLGLLIIDEEHRFGVEHKEKLKTLKISVHTLTLSATPIPRTLHMALSGLRDISLMTTPPVNRLPIRTYIARREEDLIRRAIEFELSRGGQVFYLHNRVQTISEVEKRIQRLVPSASIVLAHGQMKESQLETQMKKFYEKKANILVCTTLIESGLDIPQANTLIIERADTLGLAQLYQIRGRVGRGDQRAYAYLLIPEEGQITDDAKKRLEVIQRFVELGSGFSIASHDLEIRGGGDLLGPQQSGNIAAVGFDLYTELLEESIRELQGKPIQPEESKMEPEIKVPFSAFLSEEFVPEVHQRLSLYRRISSAHQDSDLESLEEELRDRFGPLPQEALNLFWLIRIKLLLKRLGIEALTVGPEKASIVPGKNSKLEPSRTIALIAAYPKKYQLTPESKLVVRVNTASMKDLFFGLEKVLGEFTVIQSG